MQSAETANSLEYETSGSDLDPASTSVGSQILAALKGHVDPVHRPLMYRLGAVLVASAMLLLPAIYLGLILLVGYGVYWHAFNDVGWLQGTTLFYGRILLYITPIIVGLVLIVFMIKPIFARSQNKASPLLLDREKEPLIYAFVEQLCELVGSPKPRRIYVDCQVNAAAGFSFGLVGWFLGRVDLHLGMPLIVSLELRQLASVISHEMGHFSQKSGMRLTYIVRRINGWFARVIIHRDNWDRSLFRMGHSRIGAARVIAQICILAISLVRRLLYCLLLSGHAMSAFLSRQMEFDADCQAARLVGAQTYEDCHNRVLLLHIAFQTAMRDLDVSWRERRLADDLPLFVKNRDIAMPIKAREMALSVISARKSRWFDTHPGHLARIANVRRENAQGIFAIDLPATALLADSKELSRLVTIRLYQAFFGRFLKPEHLYFTEEIAAKHDERREQHGALRRYFQDLLNPTRPLFLEHFSRW